jgi:ATP-dependent 26S proteasome regulatory subunit
VKKLREDVKQLVSDYNRTEDDLKAIQSVGMLIGDVLKRMDDDRFIVKASSGPRYVVGCRTKLDKSKLTSGTRVALDMTTLTIMRPMPREVKFYLLFVFSKFINYFYLFDLLKFFQPRTIYCVQITFAGD